jgi:preprotein translocase subunit SecG
MYTLITILIIVACAVLMLVVLIQNPKGGGLGQAFGGVGNQFFGVQRTTDFLEKATWILMGSVAVLSIATMMFIGTPSDTQTGPKSALENVDLGGSAPAGQNTAPLVPQDTAGQ